MEGVRDLGKNFNRIFSSIPYDLSMKCLPFPVPDGAARLAGEPFLAAGLAAAFGGLPRPLLEPFSSFAASAGAGASLTGFSAFLGDGFSATSALA